MSKYVTGMKRNQIIQRWLQGIDDEQYEVFPTKKEGKYIVKLRTQPLIHRDKSADNLNEMVESTNDTAATSDSTNDEPSSQQEESQLTPKRQTNRVSQRITQRTMSTPTQQVASHDSTINLEILEQLRSLGEELRNDRFKREQKQYIKHVVNKELSKPRIRSKYVPDLIPTEEPTQQPNESTPIEPPSSEPIYEPPTIIEQPTFRSRIRR